jgi:hypothetical protein
MMMRPFITQTENIWNSRTATVTADVLRDYKDMITQTTSDLEEHLQEIESKLEALPLRRDTISDEDAAERERIQEEMDSTKQCLAICEQASEQAEKFRTNVFEDVSAARDAHQLVVATLGDLISAKRVTAGRSATQWLGQMSDASLQQLSRDRGIEARIRPSTDKVPELQGEYWVRDLQTIMERGTNSVDV